MASALIQVPQNAKRGEVIEIRALIAHPMETGVRADASGQIQPRNIIRKFVCKYNDVPVFTAELFSAVAANPYLAFFTRATESGILTFTWEGDYGFSQTETARIAVT